MEWLSNLKLKASYGTQGNDGILDINGYVVYQPYLKQYSVTNNNGDSVSYTHLMGINYSSNGI